MTITHKEILEVLEGYVSNIELERAINSKKEFEEVIESIAVACENCGVSE